MQLPSYKLFSPQHTSTTEIMQTTQKMAMLVWVQILFFVTATPTLSAGNKVVNQKDLRTYASDKLSLGLGWSLGGIPSFGIGLGGGFGVGGRQTSSNDLVHAPPESSFGGDGGGGFNVGAGFDLGGDSSSDGGGGASTGIAGSTSGRDNGGSRGPNSCNCDCNRTGGGISGKSNGQNEGNPASKTVTCRPMSCLNNNDCGGYSKDPNGSPPHWCKVAGKGILPFWCSNNGESSGKLLNCIPMNCPKGDSCGGDGARYVLDIPIWMNRYGSQSNGVYVQRHNEPEHN